MSDRWLKDTKTVEEFLDHKIDPSHLMELAKGGGESGHDFRYITTMEDGSSSPARSATAKLFPRTQWARREVQITLHISSTWSIGEDGDWRREKDG